MYLRLAMDIWWYVLQGAFSTALFDCQLPGYVSQDRFDLTGRDRSSGLPHRTAGPLRRRIRGRCSCAVEVHDQIGITGWWFGTFFTFPYIGNNDPSWLSYFSEGLKPPTSIKSWDKLWSQGYKRRYWDSNRDIEWYWYNPNRYLHLYNLNRIMMGYWWTYPFGGAVEGSNWYNHGI